MVKIGLLKEEYPEKRCITYYEKSEDAEYIITPQRQLSPSKCAKLCLRVWNHIKWRLGIKNEINWDKTAVVCQKDIVGIEAVDLLHTFNTIPDIGDTPWCCTFESEVPVTTDLIGRPWEKDPDWNSHFSKSSLRLLRLCAKKNCKGLIAISTSAYNIQKELILRSDLSETEKDAILQKLICIHPPQKLLITEEAMQNKFDSPEKINFIFVGHAFFQKGGLEILHTLSDLYNKGMDNFKLTIISKLVYIADHTGSATKENYDAAMEIIQNSDWIEYYPELPNERVLELMKKSHIGLLPSLDETYGYSVLELQASGCTCVTTNIRALGEINSNEYGWLCDIKPNRFGVAIYGSDSDKHNQEVKEYLRTELERVFTEILSDPSAIKAKAECAVLHIRENHDPDRIQKRINAVYEDQRLASGEQYDHEKDFGKD